MNDHIKGPNSDIFSSDYGFLNVASNSTSTTPIVERIDKIERQIINGKLTLMDDNRKPLPKVVSTTNVDSDSKVEDVVDGHAVFMASTGLKRGADSGYGHTFYLCINEHHVVQTDAKKPRVYADIIEGLLGDNTIGLVGLVRTQVSLASQILSLFNLAPKFALCLPSSFENGLGDIYVGGGSYYMPPSVGDQSLSLIRTPLIVNPISTAPFSSLGSDEYFISVQDIKINDYVKAPPLKKIKKVTFVAPFRACFNLRTAPKTPTGPGVPDIDIVLPGNVVLVRLNLSGVCSLFDIKVIRFSIKVVGYQNLQVVSELEFAGLSGYLGSILKGLCCLVFWKEQKKFDRTGDFGLWRIKMRALKVLPADMKAQTKVELNKKARSAMILCLSKKVLREVTRETTAAEISKHIDEFNKIVFDLTNIEVKLKDEDLALLLLTSLPASYEHFVDTLLYGREELTLKDVMAILNSKEIKERYKAKGDDGERLYVRGKTDRRKCPKNNHKKSTGYVKKDEQPSSSVSTYDDSEVMMVMSAHALLD
uniref:Basic 7S globulin-like n=1 Tax=Tanacetum cinerariifolium TaxID=118510 RepID=A0A6L2L2L6_TANCI|nr:basic 7S globulin-like [Tanacetum cinerariifolium]